MNVDSLEDAISEKDAQIKQLNGEVYMLMESLKRQKNDRKVVETSLKKSVEEKTQTMLKLEKKLDELTKKTDKENGDLIRGFESKKNALFKEMNEKIETETRLLNEVQSELSSKSEIKAEKEKYEKEMAECKGK